MTNKNTIWENLTEKENSIVKKIKWVMWKMNESISDALNSNEYVQCDSASVLSNKNSKFNDNFFVKLISIDEPMVTYEDRDKPLIYKKGDKYWIRIKKSSNNENDEYEELEPKYDEIKLLWLLEKDYLGEVVPWNDKKFFVVKEWDKWWLIDINWNVVFEPKYSQISCIRNMIIFEDWWKLWILDENWNLLESPKYTHIYDNVYARMANVFFVKDGDKIWLLNRSGKEIVDPQFDDISVMYDESMESHFYVKKAKFTRLLVSKWWKYWVLDNDWNVILEPKYESIKLVNPKKWDTTNAVFLVKEGGKYWLVSSKDWSTIYETIYDKAKCQKILWREDDLVFINKSTWEKKYYNAED